MSFNTLCGPSIIAPYLLNRIQPEANQDNDYGGATNKFTFKLHKDITVDKI